MRPTATLALAILAVAAASCTAGADEVAIRPVGTSLSSAALSAAERLASARAQMALGNPGLALEEYRKALRQQPDSTESLAGIARCYEAMGRYDLSRRYFEEALAIAPGNSEILGALANSLAVQGRASEAAQVRAEIALRARTPDSSVAWTIEDRPVATLVDKSPSAVTVALPPLQPALMPPPPPVAAKAERKAPAAPLPRARLERVSLGEVALLTTPRTLWASASVKPSPANPQHKVRLLNAARRQGLAARTRTMLSQVGWRSIAIGDASRPRVRSVIFYPAGRRPDALRLAANLRIARVQPGARKDILVLLGRDSG